MHDFTDAWSTITAHPPQVLLEAKASLERVVESRFEDAVARRDSAAAVRFAKLYKPLGKAVGVLVIGCSLLVQFTALRCPAAMPSCAIQQAEWKEVANTGCFNC